MKIFFIAICCLLSTQAWSFNTIIDFKSPNVNESAIEKISLKKAPFDGVNSLNGNLKTVLTQQKAELAGLVIISEEYGAVQLKLDPIQKIQLLQACGKKLEVYGQAEFNRLTQKNVFKVEDFLILE